jgi:hypothetical protein
MLDRFRDLEGRVIAVQYSEPAPAARGPTRSSR